MKKFVTIALVAVLAVSCVFVLAACEGEPLANPDVAGYKLVGGGTDWDLDPTEEMISSEGVLNTENSRIFEAVAANSSKVKAVKDQLADVKFLYVTEYTFDFEVETDSKKLVADTYDDNGQVTAKGNTKAGWVCSYAIKQGAPIVNYDGAATIKVIELTYKKVGSTGAWAGAWKPDAGNTTVKSLTPDTLYLPPHSETATYEGSGAWNDNPVIIGAPGTYRIVFAQFGDGTYGLGAIPVK